MLAGAADAHEDYVGTWIPEPVVSDDDATDPAQQARARRHRRARAARRARDADSGRAARVRAARHVRRAVRGDRADRRSQPCRHPAARQPCPAPRARRWRRRPTPTLPRSAGWSSAFLAASRAGDFEALLAVLDPDVVFRIDTGRDHPARASTDRRRRRTSRTRSWPAAGRSRLRDGRRSSTARSGCWSAPRTHRSPSPAARSPADGSSPWT